jgi:Dehydrogenases with different specificities (related to short-chain alcohol dehydrogenases)
VVINAAGCPVVLIDDMTEDAYDRYMAVHAKGPFFLIQHAGRALRDGGRIIAISTLNTRLHPPGGALYTGAKGALENFTKVAAIEFGRRGITANVVSPGATDTEMLRAANPGDDVRGHGGQDRAAAARPAGGYRGRRGVPGRSRLRLDQRPEPGRRRRPAALTTLSWDP